jgi:hypothetical protein
LESLNLIDDLKLERAAIVAGYIDNLHLERVGMVVGEFGDLKIFEIAD